MKKYLLSKSLFSIIISNLAVFSTLAQTTISLYPNKDASLGYHDNRNTENTNYANALQIAAFQIPSFDSTGVNTNRGLFDFDLSQIPNNSVIIDAKLSLVAYDYDGQHPSSILNSGHTGNNQAYLKRVTQNWQENVVTWNTQPSATPQNQIVLQQSTSTNQDYLDIDVTQLVQDMIDNPNQSYGFLFGLVDEVLVANLSFHSKEGNDMSKYPKLEISYRFCGEFEFFPTKDVSLGYHDNRNTENTNYATALQLAAFQIPSFDSTGVNTNRGLFDFDLSEIPQNTVISSAKLNLYAYDYDGTHPSSILNSGHVGNNESYLRRVTQSWQENVVTWNTQPIATPQNQVVLPQSTSTNQDYLNIDVTQLVQDMIDNPNQSHGFLLGLIDEVLTANLTFHSKEGSDSTKYPKLIIDIDCKDDPNSTNQISRKDKVLYNSPRIYPNPANDFIRIDIDLEDKIVKNLKIFSFEGKLVFDKDNFNTSETISTTSFNNGMYVLRIEENENISYVKFIKK